jgi:hypothetical protein
MNYYDEDKVDEFTLALLYLVTHERHEGRGARAWKGFDWDTLNRLHEKGYLSNPVVKANSVGMTEEGFLKTKELFERHFVEVRDPLRGSDIAFIPSLLEKFRSSGLGDRTRKNHHSSRVYIHHYVRLEPVLPRF